MLPATNRPATHTDYNNKIDLESILNLGLDLLGKALELVHVRLLGVPDNAQTLALVWLGDQVKVDVVYLLVGNSAIVLKHVVVNGARGSRDLLEDGQELSQRIIGDIGQLSTVVLGDDERMALAKRTNVKEGKGLVALEKLEGWDFSLDDTAEDASGHGERRNVINCNWKMYWCEGQMGKEQKKVNEDP